jgi:hypothetical protein
MRIKIISEGTGRTTKVVNAETGELLKGVRSVKWECPGPGSVAVATLEVILASVEVIGEVSIRKFTHGLDGKLVDVTTVGD